LISWLVFRLLLSILFSVKRKILPFFKKLTCNIIILKLDKIDLMKYFLLFFNLDIFFILINDGIIKLRIAMRVNWIFIRLYLIWRERRRRASIGAWIASLNKLQFILQKLFEILVAKVWTELVYLFKIWLFFWLFI